MSERIERYRKCKSVKALMDEVRSDVTAVCIWSYGGFISNEDLLEEIGRGIINDAKSVIEEKNFRIRKGLTQQLFLDTGTGEKIKLAEITFPERAKT